MVEECMTSATELIMGEEETRWIGVFNDLLI